MCYSPVNIEDKFSKLDQRPSITTRFRTMVSDASQKSLLKIGVQFFVECSHQVMRGIRAVGSRFG